MLVMARDSIRLRCGQLPLENFAIMWWCWLGTQFQIRILHMNQKLLLLIVRPSVQALLDVYTIQREIGRLDNLRIGLVGDLANGRTVRSLAYLLSMYEGIKFYFVAPDVVRMQACPFSAASVFTLTSCCARLVVVNKPFHG